VCVGDYRPNLIRNTAAQSIEAGKRQRTPQARGKRSGGEGKRKQGNKESVFSLLDNALLY
jgi:hypothetical protein